MMSKDPFICTRCAAVSPTCCWTDPAATASCFPLSEAERGRLAPEAAALGLPDCGEETNSQEFLRLMSFLFPGRRKDILRAFPPEEKHLRLPLEDSGKCLFLQDEGCALSREARPWYCQLFPLWMRGNHFDRFIPESCLLTREARSFKELFAALNLTREQAEDIFLSLCRDWGLESND